MLREAAVSAATDALKNLGDGGGPSLKKSSRFSGAKSGAKGLAAGAGLMALAPLAKKGFDAMNTPGGMASSIGDKVGGKVKETVSDKVDEAGGAGGIAKDAIGGGGLGGLFGGGDDSDSGGGSGMPGVGKGRRMPVQQSVDVAVPRETAYNQFTQFEEWPNFMHRVNRVTQEDPCTVSFATKIWGVTKEFQADIETQRPDERIRWRVSQGITHTGVVTFHELAPRLTRIELTLDVDPGSLIEKFARGARHVKRAARGDLHRFKAFIEMQEQETGAWRGRIEDGELVEDHPEDYDQGRAQSDVEEPQAAGQQEEEEQEEREHEEETQEEERRPAQRPGRRPQSQSSDGGDKAGRSRPRSSGGRRKRSTGAAR